MQHPIVSVDLFAEKKTSISTHIEAKGDLIWPIRVDKTYRGIYSDKGMGSA
jgi:hypothetical protein